MSADETPNDRAREDEIARRLASLSPAKRALLEREIRKRSADARREPVIVRHTHREPAPLSFAQQRLWFLSQLEPQSVAYNEAKTFRIEGPLDQHALQLALDAIVARHEVLRTTIPTDGRDPVQRVHANRVVDLSIVDLGAHPAAVRDHEAQLVLQEAIRRPFDLAADLMLRAFLLKLADDDHILLIATHHIASDGWSMGILTRELGALYESFAHGRPLALPELPVQYADYARWQRQPAQTTRVDAQIDYWRRQLQGTPILGLASDRPRTFLRTYGSATETIELPASLIRPLKQLGRHEDATLYMILLAAVQVLLFRYSGQDDVAVGSPIAGRTEAEVEGLIGFFVNTLVLRTDLSGNPSFRDLLGRVRKVAIGAFEHQAAPFDRLVAEIGPERLPGRHPFFDVVFAFQNMPSETLTLPGCHVSSIDLDSGTSKFDLVLTLVEDGDLVRGRLDYCVDLFDPTSIRRLVAHFETLLRSAVATPDAPIADLRMLTPPEVDQLVAAGRETTVPYPRDASIAELFEAQVRQSPDAVALVFGDQQFTYQQLNWRANQVAHFLLALNLGTVPLIGISMDRSPDLVVGLLAILKTGRAYLPLDPEYPAERLAYMQRDSQVAVVLTTRRFAAALQAPGLRVIALDAEQAQIETRIRENPPSTTTGGDLAYVMYTSGSTGRPKGVEIPQRGVVRLVRAANYVRLDADERLLHLAPISFDASTFEIWGALLNGATCVVFPGPIPSPADFGLMLARYRVSTLWLTASLFNLVIDESPEALAGIRQLLIGGEALSVHHVERALARLQTTSIINGYGPTESTTFACTHPIRALPPSGGSIPIGKAIGNTEVYVLDTRLALVPVGVPGELHIGGDGLARGYLNAPELTAEKFSEVAFDDGTRRRLYRTGDRVRRLADGNLEFLGRLDGQVKIRGFRIEPGEIEAALAQHPRVRENAVLVDEKAGKDKRLVAYLLPDGAAPAAAELKTFLKGSLPDYMVPSGFVFVDRWPLTPNGKVDRRALSAILPNPAGDGEGFVAPRTTLEGELADIWRRALDVERVGVTDNFFDLGGHSLMAVRVCGEIEKLRGKKLPLTALFEAPTVEGLARLLTDETSSVHWQSLLPIQPLGSRPPFFWVHGQASDSLLPRYLHPEQPLYGLTHQAHDGSRAQYTSVEEIAAHYLREIRAVRPRGPYRLGGYCFGGVVAFEMAQQLKKIGEPTDMLVLLAPSPIGLREAGGTPAPSSAVPPARDEARLGERLSGHWQAFTQLAWRQRLAYARRFCGNRMAALGAKAGYYWRKVVLRLHLAMGWELPVRLRSPYVVDLYRRALQRYAPAVYRGPTVVFTELDARMVDGSPWKVLTAQGAYFHHVAGEHQEILELPQIRTWAEPMARLLEEVGRPAASGTADPASDRSVEVSASR